MSVRTAIAEALAKVPSSTGDDLLGFQIDIDAYLSSGRFGMSAVSVTQSGDPQCALRATCTAPEDATADDVREILTEVWLGRLRYNCWEAHEVASSEGEVVLQFVTVTGWTSSDICVTGEIRAAVRAG